jgi:hypothetical protein
LKVRTFHTLLTPAFDNSCKFPVEALYKMIEAAEGAIEAVDERNKLAAQAQQEQLDHDEPDPEGDNGSSSKL